MKPAEANFQTLIERLADAGHPIELTSRDLATVLARDPTVLVNVMIDPTVIESIIEALRKDEGMTAETAVHLGSVLAAGIKAKGYLYAQAHAMRTVKRRRFQTEEVAVTPRSVH